MPICLRSSLAAFALASILAVPSLAGTRDISDGLLAYESGDFRSALAVFRPLVERGDPSAQFMIGAMYFYGHGLNRDDGSAAIMFHKAANQGNAEGQLAFGSLLLYGVGLRQDIVKSYMWLKIASESANPAVAEQARALLAHAEKLMTNAEIRDAARLARDFRPIKPRFLRKSPAT